VHRTPEYDQLFINNRVWVAERLAEDPSFFERLAGGQSPRYLFIGCSDSRVNANEITGTGTGDMFIHRNIANVVLPTDLNLMSVVQFAVDELEVDHVIVCGHYGCGGVRAALDHHHHGLIHKWLLAIKDVYRLHAAELDAIEDPELRYRRLVECNVEESVYKLGHSSFVQRRWGRAVRDHVHGWVYDIRNGLLRDLAIDPLAEPGRAIYELEDL
jgi:carbonic anhydrase